MNLALVVFENLVQRRDELRRRVHLSPAQWRELGELEELITAFAGSNDVHAVARHVVELSQRRIIQ